MLQKTMRYLSSRKLPEKKNMFGGYCRFHMRAMGLQLPASRICKFDGCQSVRTGTLGGYCVTHWRRENTDGILPAPRKYFCQELGCEKRRQANCERYCIAHWQQITGKRAVRRDCRICKWYRMLEMENSSQRRLLLLPLERKAW